jgi:hypothetical protein
MGFARNDDDVQRLSISPLNSFQSKGSKILCTNGVFAIQSYIEHVENLS